MPTKRQRRNLFKLATFLLTKTPKKENFDMTMYAATHGVFLEPNEVTQEYKAHTCGTAACAMGYGPVAGIKPKPNEEWPEYGLRAFGCGSIVDCSDDPKWVWMFGGDWAYLDNTAKGAGKRILYYLKNGVPETAREQRRGDVPRSYTRMKLEDVSTEFAA